MNPELATIDHDQTSSPHAQEVEFALILARMINTVKQDPAQLRFTVYEFARSKLQGSVSWADEDERNRLLGALEIAIKGVEQFSIRTDQSEQLQVADQSTPWAMGARADNQVAVIAGDMGDGYTKADWKPPTPHAAQRRSNPAIWLLGISAIFALLTGALASVLYLPRGLLLPAPTLPQAALPAEVKLAPQRSDPPPFPIPTDYGIYVLNNAKLSELNALSEQVPDKRVAVSTPVLKANPPCYPTATPSLWHSVAISQAMHPNGLMFEWSRR